jgi:xanthine dehydrogenase YagS FAD-binding subunit
LTQATIQPLAGGTTLIDLMKLDVMRPGVVVDINPLVAEWSMINLDGGNLRLGTLARMSDVAANPEIQQHYPMVAETLRLAASPQLRNMATLGGNVLQRTRCTYFRDVSYDNCNKRTPGSGCAALEGANRTHAVLGTSEHCIATYPGDFAQAMIALDATLEITGTLGVRNIPFAQLHKPPGDSPQIETTLTSGELISGFAITGRWPRSVYLKARDRQSYEFALASAAVALDVQDDVIRDARVALGGVATTPWRARGRSAAEEPKIRRRSRAARGRNGLCWSQGQTAQRFKIALGKRVVARALHQAAAVEV